ncbi:hypothetical protein ABZ924_28425 [Streptomyces sp. NPDC046876]|uniref:hypothetical protein n=1 Tax=Streptomyces sp. NPDC046876 TaxID=3155616 RepID=UPI0033D6E759
MNGVRPQLDELLFWSIENVLVASVNGRQGGERVGVLVGSPAGQAVLPGCVVGQDEMRVIEAEPVCGPVGPG